MAGIRLEGNTSGNVAEVNSRNELHVINPGYIGADGNPGYTGNYVTAVFESDAGDVTGTPMLRQGDITMDYRQRVGLDTLLFAEQFAGSAINSANFTIPATTMTVAVANGFLTLNSGSSVASAAVARAQTYRAFPVYSNFCTQLDVEALVAASGNIPNNVIEIGFGIATATSAPTDGAFFRYTAAGTLIAVINNAGTETVSSVLTDPSYNTRHHYCIVVGNDAVEFWIDNVLQCLLAIPSAGAMACATNQQPVLLRTYNSAGTSSAVILKVSSVVVSTNDMHSTRRWETIQAGMGGGGYQGQTAQTMGSTTNWVNSTVPATASLSNTAAGYTTLGGQFVFAAPAGAETDFALFSFTVPAASATVPGKSLLIYGARISSVNIGAAVATTPTVMQWGLAVGSTAVSLATTEAAATKAPRRYALGMQSFLVAAGIGQSCNDIDHQLQVPLLAEPGTQVQVILKVPVGTATASQQIRGTVTINSVWE